MYLLKFKIKTISIITKTLRIFSCSFFIFPFNCIHADITVSTNEKINLLQEKTIRARVVNEDGTINGKTTLVGIIESIKDYKINSYNVKIKWNTLLTLNASTPLSSTHSILNVDEYIVPKGTKILVKGNFDNLLPKSMNKKKLTRYTANNTSNTTASSQNRTNNTGGEASLNGNSVLPNSNSNLSSLIKPTFITTFEGCNHSYNKESEMIDVYEQTYYYDNKHNIKIVKPCSKIKSLPAEKQNCSNSVDMENKLVYSRYQPFFVENKVKYPVGGCLLDSSTPIEIEYDNCKAEIVGDNFIKKGKLFYKLNTEEKEYLSQCIIDPEKKENSLSVEFLGCPVTHLINENYSDHLGKYYRIKENKQKEYLSDCVENKNGTFPHLIKWNKDKWHFDYDNIGGYRQKLLTRFIEIKTENREEIITDKELDPIKTYDLEFDLFICSPILAADKFEYLQRGKWYYLNSQGEKVYTSDCLVDKKSKVSELLLEYKNCPVTHNIETNTSIHLAKFYRVTSNNTKQILSDCKETTNSKFTHQFKWVDEKWFHDEKNNYSKRILTRYIYIPSEQRTIVINNNEKEQVEYKHYTKESDTTKEETQWLNYDSRKAQAVSEGYSIPKLKLYVKYGEKEYFTGLFALGKKTFHKVLTSEYKTNKKCGFWPGVKKNIYTYVVLRPDGSKYETDTYSGKCS